MDVLVVPNKNGVLGRQPIEAQALGVIVIAQTGHSKKSKVVKHGITGYIVQNIEQSINQLKLWGQNNEINKMAQSAKKHAEQSFNPVTNMRKIENIYLSLINK
jgi:glycosyltransferase involved in cell wall biosynthesis